MNLFGHMLIGNFGQDWVNCRFILQISHNVIHDRGRVRKKTVLKQVKLVFFIATVSYHLSQIAVVTTVKNILLQQSDLVDSHIVQTPTAFIMANINHQHRTTATCLTTNKMNHSESVTDRKYSVPVLKTLC